MEEKYERMIWIEQCFSNCGVSSFTDYIFVVVHNKVFQMYHDFFFMFENLSPSWLIGAQIYCK